jgi:predicted nucleic acid-binding protein
MIVPDINLLVYAHHEASRFHAGARDLAGANEFEQAQRGWTMTK